MLYQEADTSLSIREGVLSAIILNKIEILENTAYTLHYTERERHVCETSPWADQYTA